VLAISFFNLTSGQNGTINEALMEKAEIVILGSSKARRHYDVMELANKTGREVYNLGYDGQGLPYIRGACDLLLESYTPKILVVEIEPQFLMSGFCERYQKRIFSLAPYWDQSPSIRKMICDIGPFQRIKYLSRTLRYNDKPLFLLYGLLRKQDNGIHGYVPLDTNASLELLIKSKVDYKVDLNGFKLNDYALSLLEQTIEDAKKRNIQIILVTSPEWLTFTRDKVYLEVIDLIKDLANKKQVPYVTIMQDAYPQFEDPSLFSDVRHLNRKGSVEFSTIISDYLLSNGYLDD
jgi:hypothetical protein